MMLFSEMDRTDSSPRRYLEPTFSHLDRSARADFDRVRILVEQWFSHMPNQEQQEIQKRVRSDYDFQFHSAFLELYTHEFLLRTGHMVETHPNLACTDRHPDFLARAADSSLTIFECAVATEETAEERGTQARLDALYDAVNRVHSPEYYLELSCEGKPNTPVPEKRWRRQIEDWIKTLSYDEIVRLCRQRLFDQLPKLELRHDGLDLTVTPFPKPQPARGRSGVRPIGMLQSEACWVTSHLRIRDSIEKKATRYGNPELPYVVVVNCLGTHADQEEVQDAIYGSDGIWSSTHPSFTRLSAVIAIRHLFPWSAARADVRLFHNPHASLPYASTLTALV